MLQEELQFSTSTADDEAWGRRAMPWGNPAIWKQAGWLGHHTSHSKQMLRHSAFALRCWPIVLGASLLCGMWYAAFIVPHREPLLMTPSGPVAANNNNNNNSTAGEALGDQPIIAFHVAIVHILAHFWLFPTNLLLYGNLIAAHRLVSAPAPDDWSVEDNQPWNATRSYKWFRGVAALAIVYSTGNNMNPFYPYNSVEERVLWVFMWLNSSFMFYVIPMIVSVFVRVVHLFEEASNELDAALSDTEDAVSVAKHSRARVFARTTRLLKRTTPFLNVTAINASVSYCTAAIGVFQDHSFIPTFLWYTMLLSFMLWMLAAVNARYVWFTRRLHELSKPDVRELEAAHTFFVQRELHIIVLGIPLTRVIFARFLASAAFPLIASTQDSIRTFVHAGYL
eukprot:COSAG01_NODE_3544_length_5952_cov_291.756193_2_plen_395_part_00